MQEQKEAQSLQVNNDTFIYIGKDGGTGKAIFPDARAAYASVSPADKKRAYTLFGAAGSSLALLLLSRLLWLLEPIFDKVYYGTLSEIIYYMLLAVIYVIFTLCLNEYIKTKCDVKLFRMRKSSTGMLRALGAIAVGALFVFLASAGLDFTLKMQREMGLGITLNTALTNIAVYIYYGLHLWLGFIIATLIQYGMSILFPAKYTVPWGAIALVTVFGLTEFIFEYFTTDHLYPWLYYALTFAYASIYVLTQRSFHLSYWSSLAILIL